MPIAASRPLLCIVTDDTARGDKLCAALADDVAAVVIPITAAPTVLPPAEVIIVAADLRNMTCVEALKLQLSQCSDTPCRLFLLDRGDHSLVTQARALGATDVVFPPFSAARLRARFPRSRAAALAVGGCAAALRSIFAQMAPPHSSIDLARANAATDQIIDSVAANGLAAWLDDVRRHHEGTFQHCLLVAGIAVDFGLSLGFTGNDLHNLGLAATLHDIGKAGISLEILDKSGRLDPDERRIIERHPAIGYKRISGIQNLPPDVADAVLHHHEYLDGSGYPDRLTAAQIPDLTRIVTVVDVFAALIERRRYKPAMARERAYALLADMDDKLERPLVAAFEATAMRR
ncbi:MAG: HD domain-containing phosphohydrolase [Pseudomonadota bacterium]